MTKPILALLAIVVAALLVGFFVVAPLLGGGETFSQQFKHKAAIATISLAEGEVKVRRFGEANESAAISGSALFVEEPLTTGPESKVKLEIANQGGALEIEENSKIVGQLDPSGEGHVNFTVLFGEVYITQASEKLRVYKDGVLLGQSSTPMPALITTDTAATKPVASSEPSVSVAVPDETPTPVPTPPRVLPKKGATEQKSLSNEDISRAVATQVSKFQRCYLGYLQRTKSSAAAGKVLVAFDLEPDGEVRSVRVVSSPFKDATLDSCLVEVVRRAPFPSFTGQKIVVKEFPITLQ